MSFIGKCYVSIESMLILINPSVEEKNYCLLNVDTQNNQWLVEVLES